MQFSKIVTTLSLLFFAIPAFASRSVLVCAPGDTSLFVVLYGLLCLVATIAMIAANRLVASTEGKNHVFIFSHNLGVRKEIEQSWVASAFAVTLVGFALSMATNVASEAAIIATVIMLIAALATPFIFNYKKYYIATSAVFYISGIIGTATMTRM
ncbi:MAG: hypothetical protein M0P64_00940 [Candidatus Pacebacteria bacterium]|jgi:hypothetical protein|nr:hypothetical protein [Candidatus Paceibacterota bacterium]